MSIIVLDSSKVEKLKNFCSKNASASGKKLHDRATHAES
jgi:hypothetical protein